MNTELHIYCQYSATRTLKYITRDISIQSQLSAQRMARARAGLFIAKAADWQTANSACQTADQRARWQEDTKYSRPWPSIRIWPCIVTVAQPWHEARNMCINILPDFLLALALNDSCQSIVWVLISVRKQSCEMLSSIQFSDTLINYLGMITNIRLNIKWHSYQSLTIILIQ